MRRIFRRKKTIAALIVLLLLVAGGAYYLLKPAAMPAQASTGVVTTTAAMQNVPLTISSLGNLVAPESTMLASQQAGVISKIYFNNGQAVKNGALLVQLDDTTQKAIYNKDAAALAASKSLYERYVQLNKVDPGVLAKSDMDTVYASYQEDVATLAADAKTLAEMQIRAPFTGLLGATTYSIGSYLNVGDQIVAIVNPNDLEVSYPVPEAYFGQVALGQKVALSSDAYAHKIFAGTVVYKGPLVDPTSRSFTVRARVDDPAGLTPGMLIHITQTLVPERMVLAVPTDALVSAMSGFGVYQIFNGHVVQTYVQIGAQFGNYTEITSGLKAGDRIITQGNEKVQPGMPVQAVSGS